MFCLFQERNIAYMHEILSHFQTVNKKWIESLAPWQVIELFFDTQTDNILRWGALYVRA